MCHPLPTLCVERRLATLLVIFLIWLTAGVASAWRGVLYPHTPPPRTHVTPRRDGLPSRLLASRLHPYRVNATDPQSDQSRVFAVQAKHAGAALAKARSWGVRVQSVEALPPDHP